MVVRNKQNDRWMLPGGLVDPGESSTHAADREMRRKRGGDPEGLVRVSRKPTRRGGVDLHATLLAPSDLRDHASRMRTFGSRRTAHETSDYGFVDLRKPRFEVTSRRRSAQGALAVSVRIRRAFGADASVAPRAGRLSHALPHALARAEVRRQTRSAYSSRSTITCVRSRGRCATTNADATHTMTVHTSRMTPTTLLQS